MRTFTVPLDELYDFANQKVFEDYIVNLCEKKGFNIYKDFEWKKDFKNRTCTFTQDDSYLN